MSASVSASVSNQYIRVQSEYSYNEIIAEWLKAFSSRNHAISVANSWAKLAFDAGLSGWIGSCLSSRNCPRTSEDSDLPWVNESREQLSSIQGHLVSDYRFLAKLIERKPMRIQSGSMTCDLDIRHISIMSCAIIYIKYPLLRDDIAKTASAELFDDIFDLLYSMLAEIKSLQNGVDIDVVPPVLVPNSPEPQAANLEGDAGFSSLSADCPQDAVPALDGSMSSESAVLKEAPPSQEVQPSQEAGASMDVLSPNVPLPQTASSSQERFLFRYNGMELEIPTSIDPAQIFEMMAVFQVRMTELTAPAPQ